MKVDLSLGVTFDYIDNEISTIIIIVNFPDDFDNV